MGVHDGHRERLKERFIEHGLESFNELNALELLLFYAIPRRDTNELAHALLDRFGSLNAVFSASVQELEEVPGIGQNAAALIKLVPQLARKGLSDGTKKPQLSNSTEAGEYLVPRFMFEKDEVAYLLCLDAQKRLICCTELGRGVVNAVETSARRIAEIALKSRACSVILAHNHPDGFALPSREDDAVTRQVYKSLRMIGIPLVDHIIVAGDDFVSYADSGFFNLIY